MCQTSYKEAKRLREQSNRTKEHAAKMHEEAEKQIKKAQDFKRKFDKQRRGGGGNET